MSRIYISREAAKNYTMTAKGRSIFDECMEGRENLKDGPAPERRQGLSRLKDIDNGTTMAFRNTEEVRRPRMVSDEIEGGEQTYIHICCSWHYESRNRKYSTMVRCLLESCIGYRRCERNCRVVLDRIVRIRSVYARHRTSA